MSGKLNVNSIVDPQLPDSFLNLKSDIFRTMNCVKVGIIQSYDSERRTAQVAIAFKRVLNDGSIADYPLLIDCPVFTLQGGGGFIQFPITVGDECILLFSDRNIDAWFQNGVAAAPFDARVHDLSDGIALVGLTSLASTLGNLEANTVGISYAGSTILLKDGLISLANDVTNLLALMNGFIDVLVTLQVQNGGSTNPLTAASIAALQAYKIQFATLLGAP
jgi:hypothetical protein